MATLYLSLKKKWFDKIKSGEKLEEYRDGSKSFYWANRLRERTKTSDGWKYGNSSASTASSSPSATRKRATRPGALNSRTPK